MEKLNEFFTKIKELNFWQRLFSWKPIRLLSYDANTEFSILKTELEDAKMSVTSARELYQTERSKAENLKDQLTKSEVERESYFENMKLGRDKITRFEANKEQEEKNYQNQVAQIQQVKQGLEADRQRLSDDRLREKQEKFDEMKKQWLDHETNVKQTIELICKNEVINYVDEVPFKGTPDNTIEICDEFIVFDSKSPSNDDLTNFPRYIKLQTEGVKKYINQENVKKDIFLVVPTNTIHIIKQVSYNMGDYNVFVITVDSLEPIIISLKKIEEYEFAEKLSPEDRNSICRVIGKFAHATKRKIQIDQFFADQFIEILINSKNSLPASILEKVIEHESHEKLNAPTERRSKQILTKELKEKNASIKAEASSRQIEIPESMEDVKKLD